MDKDGLEWNKISNKKDFVEKLLTIENIYTNEKRIIELGDDLAREHQLFWDNYYKDNGKKLLDSKKMVSLEGNYIYVPITDLSMILGTVYEDSYKAVEEPALYGYYGGVDRGYALQPISENPSGFIQFIFLKEGDEYNIDEGGVLANNEYHYIIPIEEWNNLLKENLSKKDYSKKGYLYWKQPLSSTLKKSEKYNIKEDSDNKIAPPFIDAMYTIIAISIVLRPPLNNSASNDIKAIKKIIIAIYPILYFTQSLNAESLIAPENVIFSIFSFPLKPYLINPYINETTFVIKR